MGVLALTQQDMKDAIHKQTAGALSYYILVMVVTIVGFVSNRVSRLMIDIIVSNRAFKSKILGNSYIEGYWLNETVQISGFDDPKSAAFSALGLMTISQDHRTGEILPSVYRMPAEAQKIGYSNSSSIAAQIKENGDYVNYAEVNYSGGPRKLLAFGRFVTLTGDKMPSSYSGWVMIEGFNGIFQQRARRVDQAEIENYKSASPNDWIYKFLAELEQSKQNILPLP